MKIPIDNIEVSDMDLLFSKLEKDKKPLVAMKNILEIMGRDIDFAIGRTTYVHNYKGEYKEYNIGGTKGKTRLTQAIKHYRLQLQDLAISYDELTVIFKGLLKRNMEGGSKEK